MSIHDDDCHDFIYFDDQLMIELEDGSGLRKYRETPAVLSDPTLLFQIDRVLRDPNNRHWLQYS